VRFFHAGAIQSSMMARQGWHGLPADAPAAEWFRRRFGEPTEIQRRAWPLIAVGGHVLLSAPTGTGKTLAAFLPPLADLLGIPRNGNLSCLYVAPLKALVNDTARTLTAHLDDLAAFVPEAALPAVAVRTGDTSAAERRALRDHPPDILLTTPESLAVLLSQPELQQRFATLRRVVVDEVHALASSKRGADLALSLERLTALAADPQRVGLSATATPLADAARYLAGAGRPCAVAQADLPAAMRLTLSPLADAGRFLAALVDRIVPELHANRATLIFTSTRRLAEQLAWALRRNLPGWEDCIAAHHSSLAARRRQEVEEAFKEGRLRAVVSSTSLELGIDIGPVDLVVLVHPPGDVVRLLQRIGRSGHGPRRVRRGLVLTATAAELLEAAVTAASGQAGQCEPLHVPAGPLDVLCQQVAGMAMARPWSADEMFCLVRRADPYRELARDDFDSCLRYLLGLDAAGQSWLPARLQGGADCLSIRDPGTARLLRRNLGTILDEPRCEVRILSEPASGGRQPPVPCDKQGADAPRSPALVGDIAEPFADRLHPGDRFLLDGRCLEVRQRRGPTVLVEERMGRAGVPRWGGDGWPLSTALARRLYLLRVQAAEALCEGPGTLADLLRHEYGLEGPALEAVAAHFQRQEALSEIPDTKAALVEVVVYEGGVGYWWHTPLNRLGNDALARVAVYRLARDWGRSATSVVADLGFAVHVRGGLPEHRGGPPAVLRALLDAAGFDADLGTALEASPALRERFGRIALTGLMLLHNPLGQRRRVGGSDWAARRLFEQVQARESDFVLLRQARREVLENLCDAAAARDYAAELAALPLRCRWLPAPSPFAENWSQAAPGAAGSAETPAEALRRLHADLTARPGQPPQDEGPT
jgi:ATP-dependent Lhr-like helicase